MDTRPLMISLKPCYADLVFEGLKRAELRRRFCRQLEGREVFVYVSSPVKAIRGGFTVGDVWRGSPKRIWREVGEMAAVSKEEYETYYSGADLALALEITQVWEFDEALPLDHLRDELPGFTVPQSFRFLTVSEEEFLQDMSLRKALEVA